MSELNAAMKAAVESVDTERRRTGDAAARQGRPPQARPGLVLVRDDHDLPPIVSRRGPTTFTDTLREQYGPVAVTILKGLRETLLLVVLFWVSAILLAFVEVEGAVTIPGVGDATVITVALVAAAVLRGVFVAANWSGRALESRDR